MFMEEYAVKRKARLIFVSISILVFSPSLSLASNKTQKLYRVTAGKTAPIIYKDPTIHSPIIKKLPANTRWIVKLPGVKKYSNETWLHVSWNNKKGWIKKSKLVFDAKATDMAIKNPKCLHKKTRVKSCSTS